VVQTIFIFAALATLLVLFGSHSAVVPGSTSAIFLTCLVGAFLGLRLFYRMIDGQLAPKLTTITGERDSYCSRTVLIINKIQKYCGPRTRRYTRTAGALRLFSASSWMAGSPSVWMRVAAGLPKQSLRILGLSSHLTALTCPLIPHR
jgi:hypothetical protein